MRRFAIIPLLLALAGCGLQPLYGGGTSSPISATLRSVEVAPIAGKAGWLMRNKLVDRLGENGSASIPIIVISGQPAPSADHIDPRIQFWLTKPVSVEELVTVIQTRTASAQQVG